MHQTAEAKPASHTPRLILPRRGLRVSPASDNYNPRYICPQTGLRFHCVPGVDGDLAVPGVTSILGWNDTPEDKDRLREWQQREIDAGRDPEAGAKRGTRAHSHLERFIRTGEMAPFDDSPEEAEAFRFSLGMERYLRRYRNFIWSEAPLLPGWDHCWSPPMPDGSRIARVWNHTWGYAGTPDLIGRHHCGLTLLSDFKTSTRPYYRCSGNQVPAYAMLGYKKYKKCVRQLCLYKLAVEEMFDIKIDLLQIIVGLPKPGEAQMFFIREEEIALETERALGFCARFWEHHGELVAP